MRREARAIAMVALLAASAPPGGFWFGVDKMKHFLMSALVHSTAFALSRSAGAQRPQALTVGAIGAITVGVLKEVTDRRHGKPFSVPDLLWDGAGTAASAALLNRSR